MDDDNDAANPSLLDTDDGDDDVLESLMILLPADPNENDGNESLVVDDVDDEEALEIVG
jgi:hypothetical protein